MLWLLNVGTMEFYKGITGKWSFYKGITIKPVQNGHSKIEEMKKVNKQCLLDTPRTVRVSEKTWQVIVQTRRP